MSFYFRDPFFTDPFYSPFDTFNDYSLENRITNTLNHMINNPLGALPSTSESQNNQTSNKDTNAVTKNTTSPNDMSVTDWIKNYKMFQPRIDISESEKSYEIHADLPGLKKEDVNLDLSDGVLSISGERKHESQTKGKDGKHFTRIERSYGKFKRSLTLPENADVDSVQAKMENGVLLISMNKKEIPKKNTTSIKIQ